MPETQKAPDGAFLLLVAGSGFEPEPPGYEPGEVPFLYPAMCTRLYPNNLS